MTSLSMTIDQIIVDPSIQPRVGGLDPDHVRALTEVPDAWPPVVAAETPNGPMLLDGFHRVAAAKVLGLETINVDLRSFPGVDLNVVAFELNAAHGRALALRDRRRYAEHLLADDPLVSNAAIGGRAGLSATTVQSIRNRLERDESIVETAYEPASRARLAARRRAGELPPTTIREDLANVVSRFFSPPSRHAQRNLVSYLLRLQEALDERGPFLSGLQLDDVVNACNAVLGEAQAEDFANRLGPAARVLTILADALGYQPPKPA